MIKGLVANDRPDNEDDYFSMLEELLISMTSDAERFVRATYWLSALALDPDDPKTLKEAAGVFCELHGDWQEEVRQMKAMDEAVVGET